MTENNLLVSIDFRRGKGGIARVAQSIFRSLEFSTVLSLHGKESNDSSVYYFNSNRFVFLLKVLRSIFLKSPDLIVFDHLNLARLLVLVPNVYLRKVVIFLHDEEAWKEVSGLHKLALLKATHILCNSEYTMKLFLQNNKGFISKTKVCLPGGVPEAFLETVKIKDKSFKDWFENERPYCLFVSRLWKVHRFKGYFELLTAFKEHYKSTAGASLRLAIIGNGDDAAEVHSFITQHNLGRHVQLFSGLGDEELAEFYKNSSALLFPSTREGFGFVFLEAMFFKKACIGIANQPAEEIIVKGLGGVLLPDNKPETLKAIIEDIEEYPEKYKRYGEEGHLRYLENFTNEHFKERFLKCIS